VLRVPGVGGGVAMPVVDKQHSRVEALGSTIDDCSNKVECLPLRLCVTMGGLEDSCTWPRERGRCGRCQSPQIWQHLPASRRYVSAIIGLVTLAMAQCTVCTWGRWTHSMHSVSTTRLSALAGCA
jgi:hypothetical protein